MAKLFFDAYDFIALKNWCGRCSLGRLSSRSHHRYSFCDLAYQLERRLQHQPLPAS